jgi:pyrroloquinoline-quinone synthase
MTTFISELDQLIVDRRKMTSPLYQTILAGKATRGLLRAFVLHRWPIKSLWTRNILGIAARIEDYRLRVMLVENIYEEETGALSHSGRHLDTFAAFGSCVGVSADELADAPLAPETTAVMAHNTRVCNGTGHFTAGVASVLLLMEGQPPIVDTRGSSMLAVMRDVYRLPEHGYEFFVHHASTDMGHAVSPLEDEHAEAAREILSRYCDTDELRARAVDELRTALELRHRHFDMILASGYDASEPAFRYREPA